MQNRIKIMDIWVDPVTREEALNHVSYILNNGTIPHAIFASNPEKNFFVPKDLELYNIYKEAEILLPDGMGIVAAARILYGLKLKRVPGSEFIFDICKLAAKANHKVFIYGAREDVNRFAVETLRKRFPGLAIVGRSNGYVPEEDMATLIDKINASEAEILFLALGSPFQEKWFVKYKGALQNIKICQGIGGTLDTIAGMVKRAPEVWCKLQLEWLYRLIKDPKRIKRQKVLPVFAAMVLIAKFKIMMRGQGAG